MKSSKTSRRQFIKNMTVAGAGLLFIPSILHSCNQSKKKIRGNIVGANAEMGHRLREKIIAPKSEVKKVNILVVGAGIAGLSAAKQLEKLGERDVLLLEMNDREGGNSMSGKNEISAYPWGAHYLPLPNAGLHELHEFLQEAGIIVSLDDKGLPIIKEEYINFDAKERLFINGHWQKDIIPEFGVPQIDLNEIHTFMELMQHYKNAVGNDGKEAFCIPLVNASKDETYRALDKITMAQYLDQQQLKSSYLRWFVDYCCKDDFGTSVNDISAYAAIYYFAARKGIASNAQHGSILTWPEGNNFLVQKLKQNLKTQCNRLAHSIKVDGDKVLVETIDNKEQHLTYEANKVIVATPSFIAKRIVKEDIPLTLQNKNLFQHSVWMVANLSLNLPEEFSDLSIAWDNVIYNSKSLGYVNACHQNLQAIQKKIVVTYYYPITGKNPQEIRAKVMNTSYEEWLQIIINDLTQAHTEFEEFINHADLWIWGHAMVQPFPHLFTNTEKDKLSQPYQNKIFFAHSDYAGVSNFEEAFYQGIKAANAIVK